MSEDREARINLKTVADTTGAKETAKEVAKVEQATKEATKANERAEQPVKKLTEAKGRLRDVVKGLGVEFPVLGRALSFIYSPLTIITAAAGAAAAAFVNFAQRVAEAGRKQAQLEAMRDTLVSVASIMKEIEAAKSSAAITAIGDAAQTVLGELNKLNSALDQTRTRADVLEDLERDLKKQEIRTRVAQGKMTPEQARAAEAELENEADEAKAQREFRALKQKKKNQEDALRDLEPQIARLQFTPDEDLAAMKKRAGNQAAIAGEAEKEFGEQGPKLKDEVSDLQALLTAVRKGAGVSIIDRRKYGLKALGQGAVTQEIADLIDSKSGEYDALLKRKGFEADKAQTLGQRVTHAEEQNAQIARLRGAEDQLRTGIKDTDEEIKSTTNFNRRTLQLKRQTRALGVDEFNAEEQRKREDQERKEQERLLRGGRGRGASTGGGPRGGFGGGDAVTGMASEGMKATGQLSEVLELNKGMFAEMSTVIRTHKESLEALSRRLNDLRIDPFV